jgi:hypothetical protein
MIFATSPVSFDGYEQLSPEAINRALQSASRQLEQQAQRRYRYFDFSLPISTTTTIVDIPLIYNCQFVIDRILISGTYTGQPTISWQLSTDSEARESVLLPADGFDGEKYTLVLLPGQILDGYASTAYTGEYNVQVTSDTILSAMRATVSCRSTRGRIADNNKITDLSYYQDGDTLTAAGLQSKIDTITAFASSIDPTAVDPIGIWFDSLSTILSSTQQDDRVISFPGSAGIQINRIVAQITLESTGAGGQSVTIDGGFNNFTDTSTITSVTGQTTIIVDSGSLAITNASRSLTNAAEDFQLRVTNSAASPAIARIDLYVVHQRA